MAEGEPRAAKTTMPPPTGEPTAAPLPREFGKVAEDIPIDVAGPIRRRRPPWPAEEPVVPEQVEVEPGGDPARRMRKFGRRRPSRHEMPGEKFTQGPD